MIMASKLMSRNSDLKRKLSTASSSDFFFTTTTTASSSNHNTKSEINYLDVQNQTQNQKNRTTDDVWNDILEGKNKKKQPKEEMIMTLEDYLVNAGALVVDVKEEQLKQYHDDAFIGISDNNNFNISTSLSLIEPLDKVSQQRQRRMIKNRESAARSRERKQAYQVELESMAMRLEEENEQLLKEKEEQTKKRLKQLLENVIPVVEKRKPPRVLRKVRSMQW